MGYLEKYDWLTKEEVCYRELYMNSDGTHDHFSYMRNKIIDAAAHIDGKHNTPDRGDWTYYRIADMFIEDYGLDNLIEDIRKHRAKSGNFWLSNKAIKRLETDMHGDNLISEFI